MGYLPAILVYTYLFLVAKEIQLYPTDLEILLFLYLRSHMLLVLYNICIVIQRVNESILQEFLCFSCGCSQVYKLTQVPGDTSI